MAELPVLKLADVQLTKGCSLAMLVRSLPVLPHSAGREARGEIQKILRSVVGKLTARPPESLQFETTSQGKPYLVGNDAIAFNLSHSRNHSLIALSLGGDIGCDIEDRFRDDDDVGELAALILHPVEQPEMNRLVPRDRQEAFKRYWVRKEAALKAAGSGFLRDPRAIIVGLDRAQPTWVGVNGPVLNLHEKQLAEDCFAAVASMDPACSWYMLQQ